MQPSPSPKKPGGKSFWFDEEPEDKLDVKKDDPDVKKDDEVIHSEMTLALSSAELTGGIATLNTTVGGKDAVVYATIPSPGITSSDPGKTADQAKSLLSPTVTVSGLTLENGSTRPKIYSGYVKPSPEPQPTIH